MSFTVGEQEQIVRDAPTFPIQDMLSKTMYEVRNHEKILVSISGGSDSDILLDAIYKMDPNKKATYVFFDTGLEYAATKRHLTDLEEKYGIQIERVRPVMPIPMCCRKYGVPFWSKLASEYIYRLQKHNFKWEDRPFDELYAEYPKCKIALMWWCNVNPRKANGGVSSFNIEYTPYLKEYMVANPPTFKISSKCCEKAKKEPSHKYEKNQAFDLSCTGVRKAEGGLRSVIHASCTTRVDFGTDSFRPLFWLTDGDKEDYKRRYEIKNSDCYEVWGMERTGCCGCPFGKRFEQELELMQKYEPKMYKATNNIFGDSYEYTRKYLQFRLEMKEKQKVERADEKDENRKFI